MIRVLQTGPPPPGDSALHLQQSPGAAWRSVASPLVLPTQVLAGRQPRPPATKAVEGVPGRRAPTGRGQLKLHLQHHALAHVLQ